MEKEVFAYRIGEGLFCPDCINETEKLLPKDSKVQLPKIPVMLGDINLFICNQCKKVFDKKDLFEIQDLLNHTLLKIRFVIDFFTHQIPEDEYFCNRDSIEGLGFILRDIYDHIEQAVCNLEMIKHKDQRREAKENGNIS